MPAQSFDQIPIYIVVYIFCFFVSTTIVILIGFIRRRRRLNTRRQNVVDGRVEEIEGDNA